MLQGHCLKKRKKPKSKKPPIKAKVTPPPEPTKDSEKSQSVSLGNIHDPQDPKRNKQLVGTRLPSTQLDEGTRKSQLLPKVELDSETMQLKTFADVQALLLSDDEMVQESDDEEVFAAEEEMDKDIPPTNEEAQFLPPNTDKPESSHAQETNESDSNSSCPDALRKYNNILPLTERQLATMYYLEKNSIDRSNLLNALNGVTETLKVIKDAVKEDHALNKKVLEAIEAYTRNSKNITELLSIAKTFDFFGLKSLVKTVKFAFDAQNDHLAS
nr:hypothetical protein [Tanacetum cinerariifolium]